MADATLQRDVALNVIGRIEGFADKAGQIPGISQKQAAKAALNMQKVFTKEYADLVKKADKAGKDIEKELGQSLDKLSGVAEKALIKLGGGFGELADGIFDFVVPLGEVSGGLGLVAGGALAVAAAGTAVVSSWALLLTGMKAVTDEGIEARDRLIEVGRAAELPPEAYESLSLYEAATADLNVEIDKLEVLVGGAVADDLAVMASLLKDVVVATAANVDAASEWVLWLSQLSHFDLVGLWQGTDEPIVALWEATKQSRLEQIKAIEVAQEWADLERQAAIDERNYNAEQAKGNETLEQRTKRIKEARQAAFDAGRAEAVWREEMEETFRAANAADYAAAWDPMLKQLNATIGATSALSGEWDALAAHMDEVGEGLDKIAEKREKRKAFASQIYEDLTNASETYFGLLGDLRDRDLKKATKGRDREQSELDDLYARRSEASTKEELAQIDGAIALQKVRVDGANQELQAKRRAAQKIAAWQKGQAIFEVGVNTASAVMKAFALFGPPPSPAGIAAAATAGILGGVQIAAIAHQPLPSFFGGTARVPGSGMGEVQVTAHGGEAMLNKRATDDLGPQIIDALNAGLSPLAAFAGMGGGGGGDIYLDRKKVGRVLALGGRKPTGYHSPHGRQ